MKKSKGLVSVIVPIYKVEKYLRKCIDSILEQTYRNLEIILVDDGSPDDCGRICDEYAEKDPRIKVIHKENGGLSDARNWGIEKAAGDYIAFVDSDDWIKADMIEYLLHGISEYHADIAVCNLYYVSQYKYTVKNYSEDKTYTAKDMLFELFDDKIDNYAWNKLYKRELWSDVRYPVGKNFEDILTIYKVLEKAKNIVVLKEPKYYYLLRDDSISGRRDFKNRLHIYQAVCDRYEDAVQRHPEYKEALVRRVRLWYCHELSYNVVKYKEDRYANLVLLKLLSEFVAKYKKDILSNGDLNYLERKKIKAFSLGTIKGCKKVMFYHRINKFINRENK